MYNIQFNEELHLYTVNGEPKRSVTQVLKDVGIIGDYSDIPDYYRVRGEHTHKACTLCAQGWLDEDTVSSDVLPLVENFKGIMGHLRASYVSSEQVVYSAEYDICGRYDLRVKSNEKRITVELKSGKSEPWSALQAAMYKHMTGDDEYQVWDLKDGAVWVEDKDHMPVWEEINMGIFDLGNWKSNRNRRGMKRLKEAA
jgi:hypothetical protein